MWVQTSWLMFLDDFALKLRLSEDSQHRPHWGPEVFGSCSQAIWQGNQSALLSEWVTQECSLTKEICIEEGTRSDCALLAGFHYRSHNLGIVRKIFRAVRGAEVAGVIVYCYPGMTVAGRLRVLPKMSVQDLNRKLSAIMRVVTHPKYPNCRFGSTTCAGNTNACGHALCWNNCGHGQIWSIFWTCRNAEDYGAASTKACSSHTRNAIKSGLRHSIVRQREICSQQALRLISWRIDTRQMCLYAKCSFALLERIFLPWTLRKRKLYKQRVQTAILEKLAKLIHITALPLQTKVYLFWNRAEKGRRFWDV